MGMMVAPYRFAGGGGGGFPGSPDANALFLCRFSSSPPVDEVRSVEGTVAGNPTINTGAGTITLDGSGDWVTFAGHANFNVTTNWTIELHTNQAAAQVGGLVSRGLFGAGRHVLYADGTGNVTQYDAASFGANGVLDGSEHHIAMCRDGGTWRLYKDGVQVASLVSGASPGADSGLDFFIGTDSFDTGSRDVAATMARVKLSDVCRYPSGTSFTPPGRTDA